METEQEINEYLVGEEFIGFIFKSDNILSYSSTHREAIGSIAKVTTINSVYPQYADCEVILPDLSTTFIHYPISGIKEFLESKPIDIEILIEQFKNLIPR